MPPADHITDWPSCASCGTRLDPGAVVCPRCNAPTHGSTTHGQASATFARLSASEPIDAQEVIADLVDTLAPRFQGLTRLGQGGMGIVYTARDPLLRRDVAIKALAPEFRHDASARERFIREAQAAAAVAHPNVVNIFQVGELTRTKIPYFVMQYVEGNTIEQAFPRGTTVPETAVRRVIGEVAAALAAAHARGLVHRDIKPSNIMLDPHTGRAIVLDFGISASVVPPPRDDRLTATGMYVGTPRYMSPEQASGEAATEKTDIYSLGCVAYELIAGRPVFEGKSVMDLLAAHLRDQPRPLEQLRPELDRELASVVMRCLAKDPAARPTASEITRRLTPGGDALLEWPPPGLETLPALGRRAMRLIWIGDALLATALLPLILLGSRMPSVADSVAVVLLLLCGIASMVALGLATAVVARVAQRATKAIRNGYAWLTVVETLADARGDTGLVITGARQYATLTPEQRGALRRGRMVRSGALAFGGFAFLPALLVTFGTGSLFQADFRLALAALLVPLGGVLVANRMASREWAQVRPLKEEREVVNGTPALQPAPGWAEALESAATGQKVTANRQPSARASVIAVIVGCGLLVTGIAALVPVLLVAGVGSVLMQVAIPKFANTTEKARIAEIARRYTLPVDSTITPQEAGTIFYASQGPRKPGVVRMLPRPERPARPWTGAPLPPGNFGTAKPDSWDGPSSTKVLEWAAKGVSAADLSYLEMVANAPVWADWDRIARAPAIDVLGTSVVLPLDRDVILGQIPIPQFAQTKQLAYASVSRAAYYLARRQLDSAEHALRATISVGLVLSDNATFIIERLIGAVIVGIGRDALTRFYTLTGNTAGARLKASVDSALRAREAREDANIEIVDAPVGRVSAPAARRRAIAVAAGPRVHRSLRLEMLIPLGYSPCSNLRELMFGPDPVVREVFAQARRELIRFPADAALLDLAEAGPLRYTQMGKNTVPRRVIAATASISGVILANPRIAGCMRALLDGGAF